MRWSNSTQIPSLQNLYTVRLPGHEGLSLLKCVLIHTYRISSLQVRPIPNTPIVILFLPLSSTCLQADELLYDTTIALERLGKSQLPCQLRHSTSIFSLIDTLQPSTEDSSHAPLSKIVTLRQYRPHL